MLRVLGLFPYPARSVVERARMGAGPDTFLMGLNHLGPDVEVDILDPVQSGASNALAILTRLGPVRDRFLPANLVQQLRAVGREAGYHALLIRDIKNAIIPSLTRGFLGRTAYRLLLNTIAQRRGRYNRLLGRLLRGMDTIAYDTRAMAETLVASLGIDASKLWHLPYGVDTTFFSHREVDGDDGIISVGNTNRDFRTLLRALRDTGRRCRIFASGAVPLAGMNPTDLRKVPTSIARVSSVDPVALRDEYARARLVVVPLHETSTAAGVTSVLEAMAMEKAVIVAGTTGISDYVRPGETALTYRPGDSQNLATKIDYVLGDDQLCGQLGQSARTMVERSFSTVVEGQRIQEFLLSQPLS